MKRTILFLLISFVFVSLVLVACSNTDVNTLPTIDVQAAVEMTMAAKDSKRTQAAWTSTPTAPSNTSIEPRNPDAYHITGNNWYGCNSKEYFKKLVGYSADNDRQAFEDALIEGMLYGDCTIFDYNEQVFLLKSELFSGMVKIRRQGETQEYWTYMEAVDANR